MTALKLTLTAAILATLTSTAAANGNAGAADEIRIAPRERRVSTYTLVRSRLAALRDVQIARLTAYSAKGVFPRNNVTAGLLNVFVDDDGNLCAAANLIALSGDRALVDKTSRADNFIRLVEVDSGALHDWMLTSGLTIEEIDRIQEPYMGDLEPEPQPSVIAAETRRLQAHFARVLAELTRNRDASLHAATVRLMADADLLAKLLKG
jgi:hypothetical protein